MLIIGCPILCDTKTTTLAITTTTTVLIAVARLDSTPSIPILASTAVAAANTADRIANMSHIFFQEMIPLLPDLHSRPSRRRYSLVVGPSTVRTPPEIFILSMKTTRLFPVPAVLPW